jgi:hypothetical protein
MNRGSSQIEAHLPLLIRACRYVTRPRKEDVNKPITFAHLLVFQYGSSQLGSAHHGPQKIYPPVGRERQRTDGHARGRSRR